ncbi:MAG TPA: type I-B CRISPR-associated protein Cas5b [Clostridia bacterium]|nr:type I-B CRISPR-associated protein Cas5b [Clostridia bacterium]
MKALRICLYQETACYKKPFAFKVGETYPLPPYSTVKGWLHTVLKAKSLIPMQISIQGYHESKILDYQTHYFFKKYNSKELPIILDGLPGASCQFEDITQMPIYVHLLYNVSLLIHVVGEDDVLQQIKNQLDASDIHPSLGRWEDLARVDECRFVKLQKSESMRAIANDVYVPLDVLDEYVNRIPYRLNWTYEIKNGVRTWNTVDVGYVSKGEEFEEGESLEDELGDLVFLYPESNG